jgi:hypothetical protein
MPEMNRRKFLVGVGVAALAASALTETMISAISPLTVKRTDWGLQVATDAKGNWYQAFVSEFEWNGKSHFCMIDQLLADMFGDVGRLREQEELALMEYIAFSENRDVRELNIVVGDGDGRTFPKLMCDA